MQLRTQSTTGRYAFVFDGDPALDKDAPDFAHKYEQFDLTGDASQLPCKPGQKPTVFYLRHLNGRAHARVADIGSRAESGISHEMCIEAAALALDSVEGLLDEQGKEYEVKHAYDKGLKKVTDQCIADLSSVDGLVVAIATAAFKRLRPVGKS